MKKVGKSDAGSLLLWLVVAVGVFSASCSSIAKYGDQSIPQLLTPAERADFRQLAGQLKSFTDIDSIRATRISMQFTDAVSAERYRRADATLVMKRPESVRLIIQIPVARTKIAEMVSDAEKFKVAIYFDKYKQFLIGTNGADYSQWRSRIEGKKESQSAFLNARPFHFTGALLVKPLNVGAPGFAYSVEEEFVEEADTRAGAKKGTRVMRSFYVISEITTGESGAGLVIRRFWFDRNDRLHLRRQQLFDETGKMVTDVRYSNYLKLTAESTVLRPSVIEVRRPYDKYSAEINLLPESVELNVDDLPASAFVLENTEKLPVTNLDARENK